MVLCDAESANPPISVTIPSHYDLLQVLKSFDPMTLRNEIVGKPNV